MELPVLSVSLIALLGRNSADLPISPRLGPGARIIGQPSLWVKST